MTSKQQHNNLNAHTNTRENFKKIFFRKNNTQKFSKNFKKIYTIFLPYPKYAYIRDGDSPPILFTFENFVPQISPFLRFFRFCTFLCTFSESRARSSDYVRKFIPFRTNPILYNNLYIFGLCARWRRHGIRAYIGTGAGAIYVPILSLFCSFSEI